jgi:hypothetical protein
MDRDVGVAALRISDSFCKRATVADTRQEVKGRGKHTSCRPIGIFRCACLEVALEPTISVAPASVNGLPHRVRDHYELKRICYHNSYARTVVHISEHLVTRIDDVGESWRHAAETQCRASVR